MNLYFILITELIVKSIKILDPACIFSKILKVKVNILKEQKLNFVQNIFKNMRARSKVLIDSNGCNYIEKNLLALKFNFSCWDHI